MTEILIYIRLGFEHICSLMGYDHILFVLSLVASYQQKKLTNLLWLLTAFTLGHSVSLAAAILGIFKINAAFIELLIPITIVVMALVGIFLPKKNAFDVVVHYAIVGCFGLIHGLGFSNYLGGLLGGGGGLWVPLLGFNIGLELGQIAIVAVAVGVRYIVIKTQRITAAEFNLVLCGAALGVAMKIILEMMLVK